MASQRGLTLIEMLVSMVIMMSVFTLSAQAYRYFIFQSEAGGESFASQFKQMRSTIALQEQLSAAFYYYYPSSPETMVLAFDGVDDQIIWVATTGLQNRNYGAVAWLGIKNNSLVYCERSLSNFFPVSLPSSTELCSHFQTTIMEAEQLNVRYFGWPTIFAQLEEGRGLLQPVQQQWFSSFQGEEGGVLPNLIQLDIKNENTAFQIIVKLTNLDVSRVRNALSQ